MSSDHKIKNELDGYRRLAKRFLEEEVAAKEHLWIQQQAVDRGVWESAGQKGLISPDVPVEYGGGGRNFQFLAGVLEERALADVRSWNLPNQAIVAQYFLKHGTEEQRRRYLPELASGRMIAAIAMSEPGAGSDLRAMKTEAAALGGRYVINGRKTFISGMKLADVIVLAAKVQETGRVTLFVVETKDLKGFRIIRHLPKIGQRGVDTSEIEFANVSIPEDAVLGGRPGDGFRQLMSDLPYERLLVAVIGIATMERALQLTIDYARTRQAFGKPLLEHQSCRFSLAEQKAKCRMARSFVDDCVAKQVAGTLDTATASMAKFLLSEMEFQLADACLQVFGGYGYMADNPISQIFIDARAERIAGGTSEIMKEIIARSL